MKKIFALALSAVLMLSVMTGCGGKKEETAPADTRDRKSTRLNSSHS